jgi:hypothetical protein
VCPRCAKLEEEQFDQVKEYLRRNPDALLDQITDAIGVPAPVILRFIRSGRLVVGRPGLFGLACERCGCAISTGMVCPDCARAIAREVKSTAPDAGGRAGMHSGFRR